MAIKSAASPNQAGVGPLYAQILHVLVPMNAGAFVLLQWRVEPAARLVVDSNGSK
jgi:hypothetical protein